MKAIDHKYRGKDSIGIWRYGSLITKSYEKNGGIGYIYSIQGIHDDSYCSGIDAGTINLFTNTTDESLVEIYKDDVILITAKYSGEQQHSKIVFREGCFGFDYCGEFKPLCYDYSNFFTFIVVGNIHDNPELLIE